MSFELVKGDVAWRRIILLTIESICKKCSITSSVEELSLANSSGLSITLMFWKRLWQTVLISGSFVLITVLMPESMDALKT